MAKQPETSVTSTDNDQMKTIRQLVLGEDGEHVKQTLQDNAREVVSEVFSEALHDREKQDGSVNKVLLPLVEKSVEASVANHSDRFVGYLYPLVGTLVRKSVTAFITELLEKTNALIENSFTFKGLKWRFEAWRAGISFSQYVVSQTFSFRVEQVFLIHRETGILLNSVSQSLNTGADADMVSSMLTAINDFVSDSFKPHANNSEQQLDIIKTDDFTLLIKQGPKALIVAAITGNMPQHVANQLQVTIEDIHQLYEKDLSQFNGDTSVFENSENQLRDCLIFELKAEDKNKTPWMALILFLLITVGLAYLGAMRWQASERMTKIQNLDYVPGILIKDVAVSGLNNIRLTVLRDPKAISITDWLAQQKLGQHSIHITEHSFLSLDPELIKIKTRQVFASYPSVQLNWTSVGQTPVVTGNLTGMQKLMLENELATIVGLNYQPSWLNQVTVNTSQNTNTANDPKIARAILDLNIAKIEVMSITFEKGKSELSEASKEKLFQLNEHFANLIRLADEQRLALGLVIMGTTDTIGSTKFNKILSQQRANTVKQALEKLGIKENRLNAIGLGVIDLKTTNEGARKVLFNVVYFDATKQ